MVRMTMLGWVLAAIWAGGLAFPAVGAAEDLRELEQVVQARAAPGVDVLVGVADRRHRVALSEERGHQHRLRVVRVLVLVEQDRRVSRAGLLADVVGLLGPTRMQYGDAVAAVASGVRNWCEVTETNSVLSRSSSFSRVMSVSTST